MKCNSRRDPEYAYKCVHCCDNDGLFIPSLVARERAAAAGARGRFPGIRNPAGRCFADPAFSGRLVPLIREFSEGPIFTPKGSVASSPIRDADRVIDYM